MIDAILLVCAMTFSGTASATPEAGPWRHRILSDSAEMITALSIGEGTIAVGLSSGGVSLVDPSLRNRIDLRDAAFGSAGRIHSLAWSSGDLWIASEGGLFRYDNTSGAIDRLRKNLPAGLRSGVRAIAVQGDALWCASQKIVSAYSTKSGNAYREWKIPIDIDPTCLQRVGGKTLIGTGSKGLLVLDSTTGAWIRLGRAEGMSSDQITGLEWVGAEVFVATSDGLNALDLSTQKIRPVIPGLGIFWMTQVHGTLIASSSDGLLKIDAASKKTELVALPPDLRSEGAIQFGKGVLVVSSGPEILVRDFLTILGDEDLRLDPAGFRFRLPKALPPGVALQAWLRLPEWPAPKVDLVVEPAEDPWYLIRTPGELRGLIQVDLVASRGADIQEVRSVEGVGDRNRPSLNLEPVPPIVRDSVVTISGNVSGVGALGLSLQPEGRAVPVSSGGKFQISLALHEGPNRFSLRLNDGLGYVTSRDVGISYDDRPPNLYPTMVDTVAGDFARIMVRYRDASSVQAFAQGSCLVRPSVFDSFVIIEARKLVVGENRIQLALVDEAGNRDSMDVKVVRRQGGSSIDTGLSTEDFLASYAPWGTGSTHPGVHLLHYRMLEGETICGVSETFYGSQNLALILIRWNGFADSSQWRKMPVGTPIDVPFWTDFEFGRMELKDAIASFPWAALPPGPRNRR